MEDYSEEYSFTLSRSEIDKVNEFKDLCERIAEYNFRKEFPIERFTCNNTYQYIFTPTSIGVACCIECINLNIGINLTSYEEW